MRKQKYYYEISISGGGALQQIYQFNSEKAKNKWLIHYFTVGEERVYALDRYEWHCQTLAQIGKRLPSFENFVKEFIKPKWETHFQSFLIRRGKVLIVKKKEII